MLFKIKHKMISDNPIFFKSRMAQRKRVGPITRRSIDRNYLLLCLILAQLVEHGIVVVNKIPVVVGSNPTDETEVP